MSYDCFNYNMLDFKIMTTTNHATNTLKWATKVALESCTIRFVSKFP